MSEKELSFDAKHEKMKNRFFLQTRGPDKAVRANGHPMGCYCPECQRLVFTDLDAMRRSIERGEEYFRKRGFLKEE